MHVPGGTDEIGNKVRTGREIDGLVVMQGDFPDSMQARAEVINGLALRGRGIHYGSIGQQGQKRQVVNLHVEFSGAVKTKAENIPLGSCPDACPFGLPNADLQKPAYNNCFFFP